MSSMNQRMSIRPDDHDMTVADAPAMEETVTENVVKGDEVESKRGQDDDEGDDEACHPVEATEIADHDDAEGDAEEEHVVPGGLRDPGQPSPAEKAEHALTHIPYRPWCRHCVRGKAKGRQSRRLRAEQSEGTCPRIRLDYCMIADKSQEETDAAEGDGEVAEDSEKPNADDLDKDANEGAESDDGDVEGQSATILVMQESENRSVWAYGVQSKGASESWVIDQIVEDLDTIGLRNDRVVIKSDQEASAQEVSRAIARCRATDYGTSIEASSVGESNSNASVE